MQKANVNAQNKDGETPLHLAFGNGHMEIIRLLIEVRARVEFRPAGVCEPATDLEPTNESLAQHES